MKEKVWNFPQTAAIPDELTKAGYTPLLAAVLASRGITTAEAAAAFLDGTPQVPDDPLLLTDIMPAIGRITRACRLGEKAAVYGDYDVDGITSGCLLTDYLRSLGLDTTLYIPDRLEEGYGLNTAAIERLKSEGVSLIVTVDCGVTAIEETAYAASLGIDMIITDHHECQDELPNAVAVVDPKRHDCPYPSRDLAGVGVAYKLVCAMDGSDERMLARYSDLVAVGTVADVMPLTGENRRILKVGLEKLRHDPRPGLAALMDEAGVDRDRLTAMTIGYTLAPRINAAGRLGRVQCAAALMMEQDPTKAKRLAAELCEMNRERQRLEQDIWEQAMRTLAGTTPTTPIILAGEGWHQGVIGIAASRLAEAFCVPAVMISLTDGHGKGSCRSYGGFNLYDALNACGSLLDGFGGHILAAGLNIARENLDTFRETFTEYYVNHPPEAVEGLPLDLVVCSGSLLSMDCVQSLSLLEPCGNGNPRPNLCMTDCLLSSVTPIGGGKHVRLRVDKFGQSYECVWFSHRAEDLGLAAGDRVDLAFYPQINEFRSRRSVQLLVLDIRRADCTESVLAVLDGRADPTLHISRPELGRAWRALESEGPQLRFTLPALPARDAHLTAEKLALALRIFDQLGLLKLEQQDKTINIMLTANAPKAVLDRSETWRRHGWQGTRA